MERHIGQCVIDGICAGQSALTGREGPLSDEVQAYLEIWAGDFNPGPTDAMVAAWLIGFAQTLAVHFKLLQPSQSLPH